MPLAERGSSFLRLSGALHLGQGGAARVVQSPVDVTADRAVQLGCRRGRDAEAAQKLEDKLGGAARFGEKPGAERMPGVLQGPDPGHDRKLDR